MANEEILNDYDSEPVRYCSRCYSLKIKYDAFLDDDYCVDCGCTDTSESTISEWERLYQKRYGHKFTEKTYTVKDSPVFKMTIPELKKYIALKDSWKSIIKKMYPQMFIGENKAEAIILLFERVVNDNRIEELKTLLTNNSENK